MCQLSPRCEHALTVRPKPWQHDSEDSEDMNCRGVPLTILGAAMIGHSTLSRALGLRPKKGSPTEPSVQIPSVQLRVLIFRIRGDLSALNCSQVSTMSQLGLPSSSARMIRSRACQERPIGGTCQSSPSPRSRDKRSLTSKSCVNHQQHSDLCRPAVLLKSNAFALSPTRNAKQKCPSGDFTRLPFSSSN